MHYQQYGKKYKDMNRTYDGYTYDSIIESNYARNLNERLEKGEIRKWKRQVSLDLRVNGVKVCGYKIDFVVMHNDGLIEYVECKGYVVPEWWIKWKLLEALKVRDVDRGRAKLTIVK